MLRGKFEEAKMRSRQAGLLATALLAALVSATTLQAQQDQHAIAQQLLRGSAGERSRALEAARALDTKNMGTELRGALITLLERNNRIVVEATKRKEAVANFEDPEFIAHVAQVVSQLEDPKAI